MNAQKTQELFIEWYDAFGDAVFRHCMLRVSRREEARDITQETFTRVWDYLGKGNDIQNPKAFVFRTVNNLIIDWYRKKKPVPLDEDIAVQISDEVHSDDPSVYAAGKEAVKLLEKLDEKHRAVVSLRILEGMKPRDIAEILGESENVVSVRIHRGLEKLRALYEAR